MNNVFHLNFKLYSHICEINKEYIALLLDFFSYRLLQAFYNILQNCFPARFSFRFKLIKSKNELLENRITLRNNLINTHTNNTYSMLTL